MKTYIFRLYPNKVQKKRLKNVLGCCRWIYNELLGQLNSRPEGFTRLELQNLLLDLKIANPELNAVHSKTLQMEVHRLFSNLKALKKLKENGHKVGRLRFKGEDWFKTFQYNQSGFGILAYKRLRLSKIGDISIRIHRKFKGDIKNITIKKSNNKWYAFIVTDAESSTIKCGDKERGIDLGTKNYLTDDQGRKISNPQHWNRYEKKIKYAHRELSRKVKGGKNRKKAVYILKKCYEKLRNARMDFLHKLTTQLIKECRIIYMEDLNIQGMLKNSRFRLRNRNIADVSWYKFSQLLAYKAESAGCRIVKINPANTSKTCSCCDHVQDMPLETRSFDCQKCDLVIDRDHNAAINIKNLGKGTSPVEIPASTVRTYGQQAGSVKQEKDRLWIEIVT